MIISENLLDKIITEQLNILTEAPEPFCWIDGKPYTKQQFEALKNSKKKKPAKPASKTPRLRQVNVMVMKSQILEVLKQAKAINNMFAFYTHGYHYFGRQFNTFINYDNRVKDKFDGFSIYAKRFLDSVKLIKKSNQINVIKNEVDNLIVNIDEATIRLKQIVNMVQQSGLITAFENTKVISGTPTMPGYLRATRNCETLFTAHKTIISQLNELLGSDTLNFIARNTEAERGIIGKENVHRENVKEPFNPFRTSSTAPNNGKPTTPFKTPLPQSNDEKSANPFKTPSPKLKDEKPVNPFKTPSPKLTDEKKINPFKKRS